MARLQFGGTTSAVLALLIFLTAVQPARAAEEAEKFLNGLRERGYYDTAAEYLDQVKDSPLLTPEFKKVIPYEQGVTLVNAARMTGDPKLRAELFEQARTKLEDFTKANAGTLLAAKANSQLANVLVERGRETLRKADLPTQAANKETLRGDARKYFEEAEKLFASAENFYADELKKFPKVLEEKDPQFEVRQTYRAELVQARLLVATVLHEKAKTYEAGSEKHKELLKVAADKYGDMYDKFRTYLAGLYARLYQGRCYQDMKDYKTALGFYEDLVIQPDTVPAFRTLITKAYTYMSECWIAEKKYDEVIKRSNEWLRKARGAEEQSPDWLVLKYQVASAIELNAAAAPEADKRKMFREARILAKDVSRFPNDSQNDAKAMVARLGASGGEDLQPTTFDEAFTIAKDSVDMMQSTRVGVDAAKQNNPDAVADLEKQVADNRAKALEMFNLSLALKDSETDVNKLNLVRYYLCFLNWEEKKLYEAAIFGEFLAQKYPQSAGARQGAKIAMAAYLTAYSDPGNPDKDFDANRVVEVAKLITQRWPDQPEADEAYNMLVSFMIQQEKFAEAEQYLAAMKPDYADRGKAELKVGQTLWAQYVRELRKPEEQRLAEADMEALRTKALTTLETGVNRMRESGEISPTVASAGLSLTQIYLDTSQYDKAVAMLEDEKLGPLTLIEAQNPITQTPGYTEEAYKSALRAYVTINPPQLEKAEKIMDALEAAVEGQAGDSAEKLTLIFIGLGRQLEEQMKTMKALGKDDEIKQVARSFEVFLDRVGKREKGNTWASRNWVASTYYNLGSGFEVRGKLSKQGEDYYKKAIVGYQKILDETKKNKDFAPSPDAILGVQMRIAESQRKLGDYRNALDLLGDILEKKPMMLDAQIVAAYAYQERGELEDPKWLFFARQGGRKDPKTGQTRIWGWAKLAQITARYPQYKPIFHEARHNLTYTRLVEARKQTSATKKNELLTRAKADIRILTQLFPDLGGKESRDKYDRLLKEIQKEMGEKQIGLEAFKTETVAEGAAKKK